MPDIVKLLDSNTSEITSYEEVSVWADGTPMDDSKVDGIIYRKSGGAYYKRAYTGPVNVKWFGAKGDGVTDDTISINKAFLVAGKSNVNVYLSEGSYLLSGPVTIQGINSGVTGPGTLLLSTQTSGVRTAVGIQTIIVSGITIDGSLYGTYDSHYDDPLAIQALNVSAVSLTIQGCLLKNIYGSGINASGVANISGNTFVDVAGFNPTVDSGGAFDNYGDGIRLSQAASTGSVISGNSIICSKRGRSGIVIEFNPDSVLIAANKIIGYNQGIHLEACGRVTVDSNFVDICTTALLLSAAIAQVSNNNFKAGIVDPIRYNEGTVYAYQGYDGSTFINNRIERTGTSPSGLTLSSGGKNIIVDGNTIIGGIRTTNISYNIFSNNSITGPAFDLTNAKYTKVINNNLIDCNIITSAGDNILLQRNTFNVTTGSGFGATFIVAINTTGGINIEDNTFFVPETPTAAYIINSSGGTIVDGDSRINGNKVITDLAIALLRYPTTANNNPFYVDRPNYVFSPTTGTQTQLTFTSKFDTSGMKGTTRYGTAAPTTGTYIRNDQFLNTAPSSGAPLGWICTVAGTPGTWLPYGLINPPSKAAALTSPIPAVAAGTTPTKAEFDTVVAYLNELVAKQQAAGQQT